jgi:two-component system chemotaxis sensor kinase CheA
MNLEKIKGVLDKTGFLAFSLAQEPGGEALNQLLEKVKGLVEVTKECGLESWHGLAIYLLGVLNRLKAGEAAVSEQLTELLGGIFEFLLEAVENAEKEGDLKMDEEACRERIDRLNQLLSGAESAGISQKTEESLDLLAGQVEVNKCLYEVSLEVQAADESLDLLAVYGKLASCGEVLRVSVSGTEGLDTSQAKDLSSCLSLRFYLSSDFGAHALENALRTILGDSPGARLAVLPVFPGSSKYNNAEPEEKPVFLPDAQVTNEEKFRREKSVSSLDDQLTQEETEALQMILAQQKERFMQLGSEEDFPRHILSAARILAGIGTYFNRPEIRKKAEEFLDSPCSERRIEFFSLLDEAEKMARSLTAKESAPIVSASGKSEGTKAYAPAAAGKSIRVDESKVDYLMALAGELVVTCNALLYVARKVEGEYGLAEVAGELKEQHAGLDRLVRELQDAVMDMRLLPASYLFRKFPRMVRDLARELGKEVELRLEGEETEIDKAVMEAVGEPMVHLVRNAIDHGLEPVEERLAQGKEARGTITLRALREGSKMLLEVEDDGRGIDVERVREKAVSVGLVSAEEATTLTEEQLIEFLFAPGFSTTEEVTEVSGRGVGMDAVRAVVHSLGGSVKIKTTPGSGTRVRMELPLTLATSRVLLVVQDGRKYGLPIADVREMVKVRPDDLASMQGKRIAVIRGELMPVLFLGEFFGEDRKETGDEELCLVILTSGFALVVDDFLGQEDVVLKSLPAGFGSGSCFAGAAILGDGSILLVLDPHRMWGQFQQTDH